MKRIKKQEAEIERAQEYLKNLKFSFSDTDVESYIKDAFFNYDDPGKALMDMIEDKVNTIEEWAVDLADALKDLKETDPNNDLSWLW